MASGQNPPGVISSNNLKNLYKSSQERIKNPNYEINQKS